jgi:ferric-dicitrate binding protein FerR (iron transport regulator)
MSKLSLSTFSTVLLTTAACALLALPALADSQARIVRLSDVQGSVQIDKNTGMGFENAFLNLPIIQGSQVRTHDRGRAEIEFEDGSTLRLTPNTTVEFSTLGLSDSGKRISVINLIEGMAYVNWLGKDEVTLNFSREKISVDRAAHFRVDTSTEVANLAVFKGDVDVEGPAGKVMVPKKKTATFDAADNDKSTLANNVEEAPLDSWDKEASAYHDQYSKHNSSP